MPYQDVNGNEISSAQNPYVISGAAASVIDQKDNSKLVYTQFIKDLLAEVKQSIKIRRPINLFLVGEYGYGKTTLLNLIAQEFDNTSGVCISIKFQEIVTPVAASSTPDKHFESLLGAILLKIYDDLVKKGLLTKSDRILFEETEFINLFDTFFELLKRTQKYHILIAFDEVEALFSNLSIEIAYFLSFLQSLSEKFLSRPGWALCVSVTEEYYSAIMSEARQLQEGRFNFKILKSLRPSEVKDYIETKNSSVTLNPNNKIYPFEDEVIDFVAVVSGGVPRFVETICQLIWAEAESLLQSVSLETARRIFSNSYRVYAEAYFSELKEVHKFSVEAEAFFNILFYSGGRKQSIQDLLLLTQSCPIEYFYGLSEKEVEYRLKKADKEIKNKLETKNESEINEFNKYIDLFGKRPYRYTLKNLVFEQIFKSRERL
ncbi:ATP-binding protein [Cyanobacterium stanieri LEGE 03274]|uniref:ATP-binding protein n=1 Tax=Cyanobacterium stanieri LEGE 03274 TaxID=1828756 RepID=A0ABR9V3Z4_9CHRO|nr:ATP-binding protein [Cyanobacterium stanieri]MBE9222602.1 ATP-binding protein [Cyanobacterium stanieri LEGE 03274]